MSDGSKSLSLGDVVSVATFAIALLTAWLYVAGWSYTYHYFDRFRIPLLMVDLPKEQVFIYGGLVTWKNPGAAVGIGACIIAFIWACTRWSQRLGRFGVSTLVILAVIGLFVLARVGGTGTARSDFQAQRDSDYRAYPRLSLTLKKETGEAVGTTLADIVTAGCGRLLLVSGGRLFVIRPIRGAAGVELDSFIIPLDRVEVFRIQADYTSCP
ncbi:hypothetical protein J8J14_22445 [Roseomonas sp. SSH11]|uniref:Uncharacterized protein n=1 Tax=Pararoseomonas baculiformis TaxID=2820812 RepID=A0ABS4AKG5_9PROT|nr:hypothetical protein [Pararoseomonas baculiformis]MBP0447524.1 hypothetical protein [Pararoseomonas baculiformis]